jgi:hypothetical protein
MATRLSSTGGIEVTLEYSRHLGPRFIQGGVTLRFDSHLPYAFESAADWPTSNNFENAIREEVEKVLIERLGSLTMTRVLLKRVALDEVNSCEAGFRRAALAATRAAFEI